MAKNNRQQPVRSSGPSAGVDYFGTGNLPSVGPAGLIEDDSDRVLFEGDGDGFGTLGEGSPMGAPSDNLGGFSIGAGQAVGNTTGISQGQISLGNMALGILGISTGMLGTAASVANAAVNGMAGLSAAAANAAIASGTPAAPGSGFAPGFGLTDLADFSMSAGGFGTTGATSSAVSSGNAVGVDLGAFGGPDSATSPDGAVSSAVSSGTAVGSDLGAFGGASADADADASAGATGGGVGAADGGYVTNDGFDNGGIVGMNTNGYATGGMIGQSATLNAMGFANGGAVQLGAQPSPDMIASKVNELMNNPAFQQKAQQIIGAAMQSGELTPEELVTIGRIAEAAMHNPGLYPQLRRFAVQNGMSLPPSFDPTMVSILIAASKMQGRTPPGQVPPTDVASMQNPTGLANGGFLQGPGTGRSDSIGTVNQSTGEPVKVANGEYVIPKHIVDAKGRDFFDKMLRQYTKLTTEA